MNPVLRVVVLPVKIACGFLYSRTLLIIKKRATIGTQTITMIDVLILSRVQCSIINNGSLGAYAGTWLYRQVSVGFMLFFQTENIYFVIVLSRDLQ